MTQLKVLSVASEIYPLIKTGGLADVTGALPQALAAEGVDMRTLIPGYPAVLSALVEAQELTAFPGLFGTARLIAGKAHGLNLFVLDAPYLYGRPGNPYTAPDGTDWPDNAYRFGALAKVAAEIGLGLLPAFVPDVVHMHDWQAGLTAAYMHYSGKAAPGTIITVHNLAFQGQFPAELIMPLGLPPASFAWDGVEHYGQIGFLKAGLQLADRITTVSPSYASEIMQLDTGMGFDGLLRARAGKVSGILNGIDTAVWDPASDPRIAKTYDVAHLDERAANKAILRNTLGLNQEPGALLLGVVSRLSWQKGLDLLLEVLPTLVDAGMQLAVLGSGEAELEAQFLAAAEAHPGIIAVSIGYDETLAHRIQAGADALLVPSRFEPCGLTQLCALRYGAVPIVARVGGLCDTVIDANEMALASNAATGVQFSPVTSDNLAAALWRTAKLFRDRPAWQTMQRNGMGTDVSWSRPARRYADLYRELCGPRVATGVLDSRQESGVSIGMPGAKSEKSTNPADAGTAKGAVSLDGAVSLESEKDGTSSAGKDVRQSESVVSFAGLAGAENEKSAVSFAEAANPEDEMGEVPLAGIASTENGKDAVRTAGQEGGLNESVVSFAGLAGAESEKSAVSFAEAANPEDEMGEVPLAGIASTENGKDAVWTAGQEGGLSESAVSFAGPASAESEENADSFAEAASPEGGKSADSPESGEGAVSSAGQDAPPSGNGAASPSGTPGSGKIKNVADSGTDASAEEADNAVSIAWRDL